MTTAEFGDIIFFEPVTLKSKLVAFFDKGKWSHVALVLGMYEDRFLFVESHWDGVRAGILVEGLRNFEIRKPKKPTRAEEEIEHSSLELIEMLKKSLKESQEILSSLKSEL